MSLLSKSLGQKLNVFSLYLYILWSKVIFIYGQKQNLLQQYALQCSFETVSVPSSSRAFIMFKEKEKSDIMLSWPIPILWWKHGCNNIFIWDWWLFTLGRREMWYLYLMIKHHRYLILVLIYLFLSFVNVSLPVSNNRTSRVNSHHHHRCICQRMSKRGKYLHTPSLHTL